MATKTLSGIVTAALALDEESLDYRVKLRPAQALEFVTNCGDYNEATEERLEKLVKKIDGIVPCMKFGGENPNNGHAFHTYDLGREGSRVMYVQIIKTYRKDLKGEQWDALAALLVGAAKQAQADEASIVADDETEIKFRFWWD